MTLTICSSCGRDLETVREAAKVQGTAAARITLPPLPDDQRKIEPHATAAIGDEALAVLKRERAALDRANARVLRGAAFYDNLGKALQ